LLIAGISFAVIYGFVPSSPSFVNAEVVVGISAVVMKPAPFVS